MMWAAIPFVLVGLVALRFNWPPLCGTQAMVAIPTMIELLLFAAYWAFWALL
jgi:hypothetical protein